MAALRSPILIGNGTTDPRAGPDLRRGRYASRRMRRHAGAGMLLAMGEDRRSLRGLGQSRPATARSLAWVAFLHPIEWYRASVPLARDVQRTLAGHGLRLVFSLRPAILAIARDQRPKPQPARDHASFRHRVRNREISDPQSSSASRLNRRGWHLKALVEASISVQAKQSPPLPLFPP